MEPRFDRKKEIKNLLDDLRSKMGFIITHDQEVEIVNSDPLFADEFIKKIFAAENLNPQSYLNLTRKVKRRFTDKFGNQI